VYLYNGVTKFTGAWFSNRGRSVATAIILMAGCCGNYTTRWIYIWYFNLDPATADNYDIFTIMDEFKLVLFIMNLILTVLIIVFFESKP
jgi:hypothetical protein